MDNTKKIIANLTSWIGYSSDAMHVYVKLFEIETSLSVYDLVKNDLPNLIEGEDLERILTNKKEVRMLNNKDGKCPNPYKIGDSTTRFNDDDKEIRKIVSDKYPENDIIFLHEGELENKDINIICRKTYIPLKTGHQIMIGNFTGFSLEFKNLIKGTIHDVIETPEWFKYDENVLPGVWVMGVTEPVKVLSEEYFDIKKNKI